jgi:predicted RNase H-like HicB family nuclease
LKKNKQPDVLRFLVMIRRTPTGYSADVPDLPGCVAAAKTIEGTRRLITEAIGLHLELMQQSREPIPKPRQAIEFEIDAESWEEFCTWVDVELSEPIGLHGGKQ